MPWSTDTVVVAGTIRHYFPRFYTERNPLMEAIRTPSDLALFLVAAVLAGGIKEELQRAFILTRFRDHLGGAGLGLILWSSAFGAGHSRARRRPSSRRARSTEPP